jgi:hypothetical protein
VAADIRDEMSASGARRPPTLSDAQLNLFAWVFQRYSYASSQDIKRVLDVRVMVPRDPLCRTQPDFEIRNPGRSAWHATCSNSSESSMGCPPRPPEAA